MYIVRHSCVLGVHYIKNQLDATLAVLFISHCKITLHVSDATVVNTPDDGRRKRPKHVE